MYKAIPWASRHTEDEDTSDFADGDWDKEPPRKSEVKRKREDKGKSHSDYEDDNLSYSIDSQEDDWDKEPPRKSEIKRKMEDKGKSDSDDEDDNLSYYNDSQEAYIIDSQEDDEYV